ncbi:amylo-alpha-1,6-glucosidase [Microbacterium rhizosphaerae]|uniref:Glycogen debranching protein n=1 Tax=Microbacterium rhizosphaerae TaxID=1678237 RepID=A0ABZ0SS52_9MICO|nr:glycogen debranching protein [Microbacterium rhizosphaerae]WPR90097.1 glycogen debranching protein [Microbacterium rhizosphaerae]
MTDAETLAFDIAEIPFSYRGSWLNLSPVVGLHETAEDVHLVTHTGGMHAIFRLVVDAGGPAPRTDVWATPTTLTWVTQEGMVEAVFESVRAIRFRGRGLGLRFVAPDELTPFTGGYLFRDPSDGAVTLTSYESGRRYRFTVLTGSPVVQGEKRTGAAARALIFGPQAEWEVVLEEISTAADPLRTHADFDTTAAERAREFDGYARALLAGIPESATATKAAYVMWSATVSPAGFVGREAILMSKHWMDKVWSWDHCFNAIALAAADTDAALDQFLLPFDHQTSSGAIPDSVAHSEVLYNFVKPPIHGWAFALLRKRASRPLTAGELTDVYERLSSWTRFWLDHRRKPGHALPYYQHGNDSGWDNATTFDRDRVIESPDLTAFLLLQLDELVGLARELERPSSEWDIAARELETALLAQLWTGAGFVARSVDDRGACGQTSLLTAMPIVLGERLPADIAEKLCARIMQHLTPWGPATELPESTLYESDGYWRGPIWAPSTLLVEDGLRRAGHVEPADRISDSFRAVCERSGFAENFDARTGSGLRDRAYTWTAAAYLILAADEAARTTSRPATDRTGAR